MKSDILLGALCVLPEEVEPMAMFEVRQKEKKCLGKVEFEELELPGVPDST